MSNLTIHSVITIGANDKPTDEFFRDDPFGVLVDVSASAFLTGDPAPIEILIQLVNPREDHDGPGMWWRRSDGVPNPTLDFLFDAGPSDWRRAQLIARWARYRDAVAHIGGGEIEGVFAVRASVRTVGLPGHQSGFAMSAPYAATYHFRGTNPASGTATGPSGTPGHGPLPSPH